MNGIAYQNKDIASKVAGEALVGKSLGAFGLPHLNVIGMLPTNLPAIESNELRLDHLFLLSDGSLGIIDYESEYSKENFVKYINYVARIIKRYAGQKQLEQLKQIRMIVIYTADVERANDIYDLGGLVMRLETTFLIKLDTETICRKLENRILKKEDLTEEEQIQLMILPLTVKGKREKQEYIIKAVEMAKILPDREQTLRVLAGILTFSDKVVDDEYRERIKEEMQMTKIGQMIFEDGLEQGLERGLEQGFGNGKKEKAYEAAENMFIRGISAGEAADILEEDISVIKSWYSKWEMEK